MSTIIVGAGPAGLATSRELMRRGVDHRVLERGDRVGHTWANLYDSLVLHTGRHLSALPGMPIPKTAPLFVPRRDFVDYLRSYADTVRLPVNTNADVVAAERADGRWRLHLESGATLEAKVLVVATGIVANPYVPDIIGRHRFTGEVTHSVTYRRPDELSGKRVLIVGAGNSAGEIAVEIARAGGNVTVAVQSGARVVPRELLGIPIQYVSVALSPLPRVVLDSISAIMGGLSGLVRGPSGLPPPPATVCPKVPLVGLALADALRARTIALRGGLKAFTSSGMRFADGSEEAFDHVIFATGYRAAVQFLDRAVRVDRCGFARRNDRVVSADQENLYFVGHNYDTRGGLFNISLDAKRAARYITRAAGDTARTSTETRPAHSER
jgi:pyruvate/2-oxoglutarate dehydrogenase complex dihydrolipoamide dehydrogenase (E3) component